MPIRDLPDDVPQGTALATDDRSHLYREYGVDRSLDATGGAGGEPPADHHERRTAILGFYGGRCGRCLAPVDRCSADDGVSLGYLFPVDEPRWALPSLVAVCEGCYGFLSTRSAADLDRPAVTPGDGPQFPAPLGDPRIAVERAPLTAREVWLRERLSERVADREDRHVNVPARDCTLALDTDAATATALGAALCGDWTRSPEESRLVEAWENLSAAARDAYGECAVDRDAVVDFGPVATAPASAGLGVWNPPALPASGASDPRDDADPDAVED
jgi:hypothetical protein